MKKSELKPDTVAKDLKNQFNRQLTAVRLVTNPDVIQLAVDVECHHPTPDKAATHEAEFWLATDFVMKQVRLFDVQSESDMLPMSIEQAATLRDTLDGCLAGTVYAKETSS